MFSRRRILSLALAFLVPALKSHATSSVVPSPVILGSTAKSYQPYSRAAIATLGELQISRESASFALINGSMSLKYFGLATTHQLKNGNLLDWLDKAELYEVLNGAELTALNSTNSFYAFGFTIIRWLSIKKSEELGRYYVCLWHGDYSAASDNFGPDSMDVFTIQ